MKSPAMGTPNCATTPQSRSNSNTAATKPSQSEAGGFFNSLLDKLAPLSLILPRLAVSEKIGRHDCLYRLWLNAETCERSAFSLG